MAGAAEVVSAVLRGTLLLQKTPDALLGQLNALSLSTTTLWQDSGGEPPLQSTGWGEQPHSTEGFTLRPPLNRLWIRGWST
jgi:hypothetical protein